MIKVLFLTSNPEGTPQLKLDEEARLITQKIRSSEYRDVLLETLWAVRPDDLLQALNEHKPQIVHFSGHGSSTGEIVLMDDNRQVIPVSVEALKMLFTTLKDNIRVVVLNACYSKIQAKAISEVIDCVIGMDTAIGDEAAIIFAASFYRGIGFGRSIKEAFDQGKAALLLEGIPEASTPQLLTRMGVDPSSVVLTGTDQEKNPITDDKVYQRVAIIDRTEVLERVTKLFGIERIIYIVFSCLFLIIIFTNFIMLLLEIGDKLVLLSSMGGSGGLLSVTLGRLLTMWERSLKFLEMK